MTLVADKITTARAVTAPPEIIALSDEVKMQVVRWLTYWVEKKPSIEEIVTQFVTNGRVSELATKVRLANNGRYDPSKKLTDYLKLERPLVFFDFETAGCEGDGRFKVVEISVMKFNPDGTIDSFSELINPEVEIQKKATEVHGIRDEDVQDRQKFIHFAPTLFKFLEGCDLGGYNILGFDIVALQKEFASVGMNFSIKDRAVIDAMYIYHKRVDFEEGKSRGLSDALKLYCGKEHEKAHQAKADNLATVEIIKGQFEMYLDLPRDVSELSKYCKENHYDITDFIDPDGKFVFDENDEAVFNFGRYELTGETLKQVAKSDRGKGYLTWIRDKSDFSDEVKKIASDATKGTFPARPKKDKD